MMKALSAVALVLASVGCGGNANEDRDFQDALPQVGDIAVKLPALERADAAEYYVITRGVVRLMAGIGAPFLALVDVVRAHSPSERQADHRVWGPYPMRERPGWVFRTVMDRQDGAQPSFAYTIEVRRDGDWAVLVSGAFDGRGGARRGQGQLVFDSSAARAAGYPPLDLEGWRGLAIDYQTLDFPRTVKMTLVADPGDAERVYEYDETRDGIGSMGFDAPTPELAPLSTVLRMRTRWLGSGAGRADMRVLEGSVTGRRGVDCWGIDGQSTHSEREVPPPMVTTGSEAACVFPAATP